MNATTQPEVRSPQPAASNRPPIRTLPLTYFPKNFDVRVFVAGLSETFAPLPPSSNSPLPAAGGATSKSPISESGDLEVAAPSASRTTHCPPSTADSDRYRETAEYWAADLAREVSNRVAQLRAVCGGHRMPAGAINHLDAAIHTLRSAIQHGNTAEAEVPPPAPGLRLERGKWDSTTPPPPPSRSCKARNA